jgi:hypothetical protein
MVTLELKVLWDGWTNESTGGKRKVERSRLRCHVRDGCLGGTLAEVMLRSPEMVA